jgi:hypothetical protein
MSIDLLSIFGKLLLAFSLIRSKGLSAFSLQTKILLAYSETPFYK